MKDSECSNRDSAHLKRAGKALRGREAGDEVTVEAPKGVIHYRIDSIER